MAKVTITNIWINDKDKSQKPLLTKEGRPYKRVVLSTKEYGQRYITGYYIKDCDNWKVNDEIELDIYEMKGFLNFKIKSKFAERKDLKELEIRVKKLEDIVNNNSNNENVLNDNN